MHILDSEDLYLCRTDHFRQENMQIKKSIWVLFSCIFSSNFDSVCELSVHDVIAGAGMVMVMGSQIHL